ncbi:hypothetical protein GCM10011515_05850 [Tsuneonella deserti]|uniref:Heat induced stress protein YflT n=1 Tax=Tsuneonella deserti TaxID=2035528 RepID=A0ABQ1S110_9SPHN|nr:general stress protein [Tsuneonella deserti]GGD88996.1 hypothetical protein GCM10011515_05850 [Tsuneonella deserti]
MPTHAIFDSHEHANRAVGDLRNAGVRDDSISMVAHHGRTVTTTDADGTVTDEDHTNVVRGILGGGALGAGLGVAALAIPGVGPLVAAGAIASGAVPGAMGIGALAGAALGSVNEVLKDHGVDDEDAEYYGQRMKDGAVFLSVDDEKSGYDRDRTQEVLYGAGGHNSRNPRV